MSTKELQDDIKTLINRLGWSQNKLAEVIYTYQNDDHEYCDQKLKLFKDSLKKELSRSSTKAERLQTYLDIIAQDRDFQKLSIVIPPQHASSQLDKTMQEGMLKISKKLTNILTLENDK
jgi:hypothetical protein